MSFTLRCRRCNGPHYQHEDANKHGGTGWLLHWEGDLCPVCQDKQGKL